MFVLLCCCGNGGTKTVNDQRQATQELNLHFQNLERPPPDIPVHQHSLAFMPTGLTRRLRQAGLVTEKPTVPELIAVFQRMDKDGNGQLDREELKEALASMGTDTEQMDELIKEADTDGDGKLSLPEFLNAMTKKDE